MNFRRICVFCGSNSGNNSAYRAAEIEVGRLLAGRDIEVVYGAGNIGLMGILADAALAAGDAASAADIYAQILAEDSSNVPALAGLVRCYVQTGALDKARQTLAMVPSGKQSDAAVAAARAALELAEQAETVGPIGELEQKVAANPLDHQARFDLALALNGKGRRLDALEHLLAIVKRDRKWNDDAARKQLVQFFDAWGPTDEATIEGRKRLSSILFA